MAMSFYNDGHCARVQPHLRALLGAGLAYEVAVGLDRLLVIDIASVSLQPRPTWVGFSQSCPQLPVWHLAMNFISL